MLVTDAALALALTSSSSSSCAAAASAAGPGSSSSSSSLLLLQHGSPTGAGNVGHRFGTVYVGCRRVRPSSKQVSKALKLRKQSKKRKNEDAATVDFEVEVEVDGDELPKQEATKPSIENEDNNNEEQRVEERKRPRPGDYDEEKGGSSGGDDDQDDDENDDDDDGGYYRFPGADADAGSGIVSSTARRQMEEELADLAGEREGVPPVALPYAMMRLAVPPVSSSSSGGVPTRFVAAFDEDLSRQWSQMLKNSLQTAEALRDQDDRVRKLPYVLEPEPWIRKKPPTMLTTTTTTTTAAVSHQDPSSKDAVATVKEPSKGRTWFPCHYDVMDHKSVESIKTLQEQLQQHQVRAIMKAAVVQCLHNHTHLHISCGSKFGCDYLLYEGSRHLFHAFAGVRVVVLGDTTAQKRNDHEDSDPLPVPRPYDMTGYVRGLNTAGKLALLATVIKDNTTAAQVVDDNSLPSPLPRYRVAIVDLALKKIRATTFRGASGTVTPKMLPKRPEAVASVAPAAASGVGSS